MNLMSAQNGSSVLIIILFQHDRAGMGLAMGDLWVRRGQCACQGGVGSAKRTSKVYQVKHLSERVEGCVRGAQSVDATFNLPRFGAQQIRSQPPRRW